MDNPYLDFDFESTENDLLVAVDLSKDFTSGCLGTKHACDILPWAAWFIKNFKGEKKATLDTHGPDYLDTQEGRNLPIVHGQKGTLGWSLATPISAVLTDRDEIIEKDTFGSVKLFEHLRTRHYEDIYFLGADTGICVISCAVMAKAADPESRIHVLSKLCSCVDKDTHETALAAMRLLQMDVM